MKFLSLSLACVAIALLTGPAEASIELVTNGGFETGNFTGWTTTPASSGSSFGVGGVPVASGSFSAFFAAFGGLDDSISQLIPTTPSAQYTFSFFATNSIVGGDSIRVLWNGVAVFSQTPLSTIPASPTFQQFAFSVTAIGTSTPIEIRGYDGPGAFYIDNVSVTANDGAVPEAASLVVWSLLTFVGITIRRHAA